MHRLLESLEGRPDAAELERERLRSGFAALHGSPATAAVTDRWVTVECGQFGQVPVRIVRARDSGGALPAVVYLHGGGWVAGDTATHERLVADLAVEAGVAVVVPQYGLAPDVRYPTAIEQAYATVRWVCADGDRHGLDPNRVAVGGDSSGANMAIAITLLSLRRNEFSLGQLVAFTPLTDTTCDTASCMRFADGYFLRRDDLRWCWDQYLPDPHHSTEDTAAPLRAQATDLRRFPPTLIITAEADVARDEGEAFAARLRQAGAPTTAIRYEGTIHGFVALAPLRRTSASRAATAQAATTLRTALSLRK
ncbi:alpha/beta hydrolase [Mycolicibacterium sp. S2-37]|uniref:alpha/beta hydrolase n=1 Tax=Mycolicibacterium sp. S2-37 TaxID=2810297 RepID=UPI001A94393F|nr:alpha/beta hydrolase [Mycolicibacterium sp. S2-37]MBO0680370.1 alpha/beta hydrolase [Mycolicibacterium sp. S2-37]